MNDGSRPGPKPKRLYLRIVRYGDADRDDLPAPRQIRTFLEELDRTGRLVARGPLTEPPGDLVVFRARDPAEARRALRSDPFRSLPGSTEELAAWNPTEFGAGVNLEPPPARGSGRLTLLQRVTVVVKDQPAAQAWYQEVLGLTLRTRDAETGYVELALGKGAAALSLVAPRAEWGEPYYSEAVARIGARTGIVFETDSVPALELRLKHAGARVTQPPDAQPWGGVTLRFADPDGNEFLAFQRGPVRPTSPLAPSSGENRRKRD